MTAKHPALSMPTDAVNWESGHAPGMKPHLPIPRGPGPHSQPPHLVGDHELLEELVRDNLGITYRARNRQRNRLVAVRLMNELSASSIDDPEDALALVQAEDLSQLQHPKLIQVIEVREENDRPFVVLELISDGTLRDRLDGSPKSPRQSAMVVRELAKIMHDAHRFGIVHRELRPENVLVLPRWALKIVGFPVTRQRPYQIHDVPTAYDAPEHVRRTSLHGGVAGDVYSLGAILYEMITGRPPFLAETGKQRLPLIIGETPTPPTQICANVPKSLEMICLRCLEKKPNRRYSSADQLSQDLQRFLRGEPLLVPIYVPETKW